MSLTYGFFRSLKWPRHHPSRRDIAARLYRTIVLQARCPTFYRTLKIKDTVDGRFELLVLHLFMFLHCFRADLDFKPLVQAIMEEMVEDLDRALRELGVGDLIVGRNVKNMVKTIYRRLENYGACHETGKDSWRRALSDIFYLDNGSSNHVELRRLFDYTQDCRRTMSGRPLAEVLTGKLIFPSLPEDEWHGMHDS